ncbi:hypothetical protein PLICRDRAFT_175759 [Plicaturopsis crispa FD-325 SS-3]|nr:hypothetical protein PLICRDRAFT_175759 [Plicaturopsis crispa FD-325 SS-3]
MDALLTKTSPSDWQYVAEGGATIVFSYAGAAHPQFTGTVLRLRKTLAHEASAGANEDKDEDVSVEFQHSVIQRVVDPQWLPRLDSVPLDRKWLERFAFVHDSSAERPGERRQAQSIDVTRKSAVLATDLVGGESLAIEIKPKWAFLPNPKHLSPTTFLAKTRTCRFCMHAHSKGVPTTYCPLDLFSTSTERMRAAVGALWDSWIRTEGSANNLRIFMHGKVVSPENVEGLCGALGVSGDATNTAGLRDAFVESLVPLLMSTPVLRTIANLQRSLDAHDIEGLYQLWHAVRQHSPSGNKPNTFSSQDEPSMAQWTHFLDVYLSSDAWQSHSQGRAPPQDESVFLEKSANDAAARYARAVELRLDFSPRRRDRMQRWEYRRNALAYHNMAYLLSATFKDCSIILCPSRDAADTTAGRVTIIDLDMKSIARLEKWQQMDQAIATAYSAQARGGALKRCRPSGDIDYKIVAHGQTRTVNDTCTTSIHSLANELLAEIFEFCVIQPDPFFVTSSIVLSHVCKRWRNITLGIPLLWSHLSFRFWHMRKRCVKALPALLERSRGFKLSLTIDLGEHTTIIIPSPHMSNTFLRLIGGLIVRTRHISITASYADFVQMARSIALDAAPCLESAEIIVSDIANALGSHQGSMERHFGLKGCPLLRSCRIQGYTGCTRSLLHNLNPARLETLDIRQCTGLAWDLDALLAEENVEPRAVLFPCLRSLNISCCSFAEPVSQTLLAGSSLTSLKMGNSDVCHGVYLPGEERIFQPSLDPSGLQELTLSAMGDLFWVNFLNLIDPGPPTAVFPACRSLTLTAIQAVGFHDSTVAMHPYFRRAFPALTRLVLVDMQPGPISAAFASGPLLQDVVVVRPLGRKEARSMNSDVSAFAPIPED